MEAAIASSADAAAGSIALTAFGADSLIELFSATVVLRQRLRRHSGKVGLLTNVWVGDDLS